jgi:two-component system invasion response regulator UvrY
MPMRVLLADDADLMRRAIQFLLRQREELAVVGEASSLPEAIEKARELRPDIVVIDLNMAGRDRVLPAEVKTLLNGAKILAITFGMDDGTTELAFRIGVAKLLDKMNLSDKLIPTILGLGLGPTGLGREAKFWKRTGLTLGHNEGTNKSKRFPAAPAGAEGSRVTSGC